VTPNEIKQARQSLGLSQTDMASAMGVNRVTYTKWERGEQGITAGPKTEINMLLYMQRCNTLNGWLIRQKK
jgi:DNA-binding XRE family transcriptional regulator